MFRCDTEGFPIYPALPSSSYEQVADFLRRIETDCILKGRPSDGTVSFGAISRCLHDLGRPDRNYRSVHVTGTNGKTTVCRMIASLLQRCGMKVGLYSSSYFGTYRERISVNGRPIGEQEFVDACNHVKPFVDWEGVELTPFEFLTAAAFFAFRVAKVDYAIIEVGIGGRQDATNVIAPEVSVITNVDYDHMDVLGDTLEQIAAEKAGIIKPFTPVVCGTMSDGPRAVVMTRAADIKAPVLLIGQEYEVEDFTRLGLKARASFRVGQRVWRDVEMNSPAAFMATNAAHALAAYDTLRRRGLVPDLDEAALRTVFEQIELSTCCEVVHGAPVVLLDGAHNASAAASLAAMLRSTFEGRRHVLVISIDPKKEYEKMVRHLADAGADRAIFTICPRGDSVPPQVLAELWRSRTAAAAEVLEDPDVAFSRAVLAAGSEGQVVVTGSTQLAGYCWRLAKAIAAGRVGRESI